MHSSRFTIFIYWLTISKVISNTWLIPSRFLELITEATSLAYATSLTYLDMFSIKRPSYGSGPSTKPCGPPHFEMCFVSYFSTLSVKQISTIICISSAVTYLFESSHDADPVLVFKGISNVLGNNPFIYFSPWSC